MVFISTSWHNPWLTVRTCPSPVSWQVSDPWHRWSSAGQLSIWDPFLGRGFPQYHCSGYLQSEWPCLSICMSLINPLDCLLLVFTIWKALTLLESSDLGGQTDMYSIRRINYPLYMQLYHICRVFYSETYLWFTTTFTTVLWFTVVIKTSRLMRALFMVMHRVSGL